MSLTSADRYDRLALSNSQVQLLSWVADGASVLELGASTGYMSRALREKACHVVAMDHDRDAVQVLADCADEAHWGDLEDDTTMGFVGGRRFDVVVLADVLEHLRDPGPALRRCATYLNAEGRVLVTMPNVAFWRIRQNLLAGRWDMTENGIMDETHLRFFTRATAQQLFASAGFRIDQWEPVFDETPLDGRVKNQFARLWPAKQRLNARLRGSSRWTDVLAYQYLWSLAPEA